MSLELFFHPLSSFSHKALIALYENGTPFTPRILSQDDPDTGKEFAGLWPTCKFPLLRDNARDRVVPESSLVIEYLDTFYPGARPLIPPGEAALEVRLWDRVFDTYVQLPMQKIVGDTFRADGEHDAAGVAEARAQLRKTYVMVEAHLGEREWIAGGAFSMADCSACPALFYADTVEPLGDAFPRTKAYLNRLLARPSFARVLEEAEPYFHMFPLNPKPSRALR